MVYLREALRFIGILRQETSNEMCVGDTYLYEVLIL